MTKQTYIRLVIWKIGRVSLVLITAATATVVWYNLFSLELPLHGAILIAPIQVFWFAITIYAVVVVHQVWWPFLLSVGFIIFAAFIFKR
ncbi:MAG TPA: hypothetical protein VM056_05555 [Terriglobales bacterium]|nr:hypothetical protein [Terriglobales bacterium]